MKLIFEKHSLSGGANMLPKCGVPVIKLKNGRKTPLNLPSASEIAIDRHYSQLADRAYGVNRGFYPLGSCTMKYNPKINEYAASLEGFSNIHPLQEGEYVRGCAELLKKTEKYICELTGMDEMSFQPAAGAHGELSGIMMIKAFHKSRKDTARTKIIIPDSAHGTNPASANVCGYKVVNIPSKEDGRVDIGALRNAVGADTAGIMLTNPNTVGLFEKDILEITEIVHGAGGLCYYDGANMNAIMGITRPGDMGFDVVHLNLHKTFSTPHGGGGPGSGPVGCKKFLSPFLPIFLDKEPKNTIGRVMAFHGNFAVVIKAFCYILSLGGKGLKEASENAVLNSNYLCSKLKERYDIPFSEGCMHEFVISAERIKKKTGVSAMDVAKSMIDYGIHPPTMYFPLIVGEALMFEPTETEDKETLDRVCGIMFDILDRAEKGENLHLSPKTATVGRPDEVKAARHPVLKYNFE